MTRPALGVVVLAGGKSARMGRPKAWLPWGEEALLTRVIRRLTPLGRVVVVAARGQALPPLAGALRVDDRAPDRGPLEGLAGGLEALDDCPWVFVATTDAPFVAPPLAEALLRHRAGADAVVPTFDERPQPLLALYRPAVAATARTLLASGERRARALAEAVDCRRPDANALDPGAKAFLTINTPEGYAAALRLDAG